MLHRDLKPSNIMIDEKGQPVVMDFGLVKTRLSKGLTQDGDVLGSPLYMSPEQLNGEKLDARCDIYALGAIFYEMLTEKKAITADSLVNIMFQVAHGKILAPRDVNEKIPKKIESICLKCLEKKPTNRYTSLKELIQDITNYKKRRDISVKNRSLYNLEKKAQTYRYLAFPLVLLTMILIWRIDWEADKNRASQLLEKESEQEIEELRDAIQNPLKRVRYYIQYGKFHNAATFIKEYIQTEDQKLFVHLTMLYAQTLYKMKQYNRAYVMYKAIQSFLNDSSGRDRHRSEILAEFSLVSRKPYDSSFFSKTELDDLNKKLIIETFKCSIWQDDFSKRRQLELFNNGKKSSSLYIQAIYYLGYSYKMEFENKRRFNIGQMAGRDLTKKENELINNAIVNFDKIKDSSHSQSFPWPVHLQLADLYLKRKNFEKNRPRASEAFFKKSLKSTHLYFFSCKSTLS